MAGPIEFKVSIGEDVVGLRCLDPVSSSVVREWCAEFLTSSAADFWLEIELESGRTPPEIQAIWPMLRVLADHGRLYTYPALFEAQLSAAERTLCFRSEEALFHPSITPRFLNVLLSYAYNTIWDLRGGHRGSFLFHGCGVSTDRGALLFTGPSGKGKTTVARLAGPREVLNDEAVLVQERQGGLWMCGTPLLGGVNRRSNTWHRVSSVLVLEHGPEPVIERLSKGEGYWRFLTQLFGTDSLLSTGPGRDDQRSLEDRADLSALAARTVPMYEMYFRPDGSFWPLVEAL